MRRLAWCDSTTATAPPRVRVERFCGKARYRVHVLGEFRAVKVHFKFGENTVPCAGPDPCHYCGDPQVWKTRWEHFAAALLRDDHANLFVPIVAILTDGGFKKVARCGAGSYRGRLLDIWRVHQGTTKVLQVRETGRVDPPYPAFDIEPHLLRMWFPHDTTIPAGEVPPPLAFEPEAIGTRPVAPAEVFVPSEEARSIIRSYVARLAAEPAAEPARQPAAPPNPVPPPTPPAAPPPPPPVVPPVPPAPPIAVVEPAVTRAPAVPEPAPAAPAPGRKRVGLTPTPDQAMDALRRRAARAKPASELDAEEAVEFGRIVDFVIGDRVPSTIPIRNGKHPGKNGGDR
jgi:hypothetical protein